MSDYKYLSAAETAKLIRTQLKANFPTTQFYVNSKTYSGGASIDISWMDGPGTKQVQAITNPFSGARFDGMQDLKEYNDNYLTKDGRATFDPTVGAERVHFGADYIFESRSLSPDACRSIVKQLCDEHGRPEPEYYEGTHYRSDKPTLSPNTSIFRYNDAEWLEREINEAIRETDLQAKRETKPTKAVENSGNCTPVITHERDWTWIKFPCKPAQSTLETMKSNGARFSGKRVAWYFTRHVEQDEITALLGTVETASQAEQVPSKIKDGAGVASKLRATADKMDAQIQQKMNPAIGSQNYTARRARIAASMYDEGVKIQETQSLLYKLADAHEADDLDPLLHGLTSRAAVDSLRNCNKWIENPYYAADMQRLTNAGITPLNIERANSALNALLENNSKAAEEKKRREIENEARRMVGLVPGYFPTPAAVVEIMLDRANLNNKDSVLEPSAGAGHIADRVRDTMPGAEIEVIEINPSLREFLSSKGYHLLAYDFMEYANGLRFTKILMNPPFENLQDIDHVMHAYELLEDGGTLVSVMSPSPFFRSDQKAQDFRDWLDGIGGEMEELPEGSFKSSGTGVASRLVTIRK